MAVTVGERAGGETSGAIQGNDYTSAFRELVDMRQDFMQRRQKWEKQRDDALGPILTQNHITLLKGKEKSGQGLTQRERDCLKLRKADEEWIGEARKVVSSAECGEKNGLIAKMVSSTGASCQSSISSSQFAEHTCLSMVGRASGQSRQRGSTKVPSTLGKA